MPLVVDASVALAWALPDESSAYADAVLAVVERDGLWVPELWASEIANGLAVAYRRQRITPADEAAFLKALSRLRIDVEVATSPVTSIRAGTAAAMSLWLDRVRCGVHRSGYSRRTRSGHSRCRHAQGSRKCRHHAVPIIERRSP